MATSAMMPAGWYADPSSRHEYRYWSGTEWTATVSDGGVAATDTLAAGTLEPSPPPSQQQPPEPSPQQPAAPSPQEPAAAPRRRRWVLPVIVVAAGLGLIAGLLVWAPWASPPLLRPVGLRAGPSTTSSVALHWSGPATGPVPDRYAIFRNGGMIGSVPGTVTAYRDTGLAPATEYAYRVAAVRAGHRSAPSSVLAVKTLIPPISAARFQGPWDVDMKIVRGGGELTGIPRDGWAESWLTSPKCAAGPCAVVLTGAINGHNFRVTLNRAGAVYTGTTKADVFPCGSGAGAFPLRHTLTFRIKIASAQVANGSWVASTWGGTVVMVTPYTSSGDYYCPAHSVTASLSG